jgi:hypothetical protein
MPPPVSAICTEISDEWETADNKSLKMSRLLSVAVKSKPEGCGHQNRKGF